MSATARQPRATKASATSGYLGSVIINAVILYLINVAPGWGQCHSVEATLLVSEGLVDGAQDVDGC